MIINQFEEIKKFIEKYILKKGEQIEPVGLDTAESITEGNLHELTIVKRTVKTYRKTGMLIVAVSYEDGSQLPSEKLLEWSVGRKADLKEDSNTFTWLEQGWIMKEYRFKQDGRTAERISYRMGLRLFQYKQGVIDNKREAEDLSSGLNCGKRLGTNLISLKLLNLLIQILLLGFRSERKI